MGYGEAQITPVDVSSEIGLKDSEKINGLANDQIKVPTITLTDDLLSLDRNTKGWKKLVDDVADACENHGIFLLDYPKVTVEKQNELFEALKVLFDCPLERKRLYKKAVTRDGGYMGNKPSLPLYEAFAIYREALNDVRAIERLMWPESTDTFVSDSINYFNTAMEELVHHLMDLVFEGLGIPHYSKKETESIEVTLRIARYKAPPLDYDKSLGLSPHVDKSVFTFLYQNGVQGLEAKAADGTWKEVAIPNGTMLVFLGDVFEVWSNGKYKGVEHRVVMKPGIERYSYTCFILPKDEAKLEVPSELVDEEHPLRYKPFVYADYLQSMGAFSQGMTTLECYAGLLTGLRVD